MQAWESSTPGSDADFPRFCSIALAAEYLLGRKKKEHSKNGTGSDLTF
jgi:hypothetical protein